MQDKLDAAAAQGAELERTVSLLKAKLAEQKALIARLTGQLDEQRQLRCAVLHASHGLTRRSEALAKRKDYVAVQAVQAKQTKDMRAGHDCLTPEELQRELDAQKVAWTAGSPLISAAAVTGGTEAAAEGRADSDAAARAQDQHRPPLVAAAEQHAQRPGCSHDRRRRRRGQHACRQPRTAAVHARAPARKHQNVSAFPVCSALLCTHQTLDGRRALGSGLGVTMPSRRASKRSNGDSFLVMYCTSSSAVRVSNSCRCSSRMRSPSSILRRVDIEPALRVHAAGCRRCMSASGLCARWAGASAGLR